MPLLSVTREVTSMGGGVFMERGGGGKGFWRWGGRAIAIEEGTSLQKTRLWPGEERQGETVHRNQLEQRGRGW